MKRKQQPKKISPSPKFGKAWAGRFTQAPDPRAERYTESLGVDIQLLPYDIRGSQAHARMLGHVGVIPARQAQTLVRGLDRILREWKAGKLKSQSQDEDVHMLVERRLHELLGPRAGVLHTARSRNDQVALDLKLYLRTEVEAMIRALQEVQRQCLHLARRHLGWIMPGYTHMQVAQPVLVSHWLLAHLEALARDEKRMRHLRSDSLEECPLGAAALAGTSHAIDRNYTAKMLGFKRITANSMDTVADRDFVVEFLSASALCGVHLSRLAEELVWFSGQEFGFVIMDQRFATGSSIMPQKRNPDVAELMRGRCGRLLGNWVAMLAVLKGLPLTYNRDLQEDKTPVFDSAASLRASLEVLAPMLRTLRLNRQRMMAACAQGFPNATAAADHLVRQGVPFREAHAAVGHAVTHAAEQGRLLEQFSLEEWRRFQPEFQTRVVQDVRLAACVASKRSAGGTALARVREALSAAERRLFKSKSRRP